MLSEQLILGNVFSFGAAVCLAVSVMKNSKKSLIGWQIGDTFLCVISNLILLSYSAMTISAMCLIRNLLAYSNHLTKVLTCVLLIVGCAVGLYANNRGYIGILPVIATMEYTILMYTTKNAQQMRYALIVNLLMWFLHDAYIQAYPMAFMDVALSIWTSWQTFKNYQLNHITPRARK